MESDAVFSKCRAYRYSLWRIWDESIPYVAFIGLNPSTADEKDDDRTITRCIDYSKKWGYGGLCMVNLFALCTKDPAIMMTSKDPVGPENNDWLKKVSEEASIVVAAWGNDGAHLGRSKEIIAMFPKLKCLKLNKSGEPAHPLYQKSALLPIDMK